MNYVNRSAVPSPCLPVRVSLSVMEHLTVPLTTPPALALSWSVAFRTKLATHMTLAIAEMSKNQKEAEALWVDRKNVHYAELDLMTECKNWRGMWAL